MKMKLKMTLTRDQQAAILKSLPYSTKKEMERCCKKSQMKGDGIKTILKKVGAVLGPIAKTVGPIVLKEFLIPFMIKKAKSYAGMGMHNAGGALKLAGQGDCVTGKCHGTGLKLSGMGLKMHKLRMMRGMSKKKKKKKTTRK
jgi:hypothetical protein